jgi:hypothetical protein
MTKFPDLFAALTAPFGDHEVKQRTQGGRTLHYITARTAMNRLDAVLGPENWWDHYQPGENSVLCTLTIRLPSGECLAKQDAGGYAGMADQGDDDKSGFSDAFKRACAKFGVGRYLYRDGVPHYAATPREPGSDDDAPSVTYPADPSPRQSSQASSRPAPSNGNGHHTNGNGNGNGSKQYDGPPKSGKALFAWTKDAEQKHQVGLLKYINGWAKLQDFPGRMVDWDADQVALAYAEACRKLQSISASE